MPTFGNTNIEPTEGSWELGLYQDCKFTKPEANVFNVNAQVYTFIAFRG